uniref:HECT domain-containing protein n=1 Tax=Cyprinus carpio TaxID=7962 RepID=A0A8C2FG55_CYPCA
MSCGYLGVVTIILHATLKLIPMLQEIRKGLQLYGIGGLMEKHPEICQPLFVPGTETAVSIVVVAEFSEKGSYREQVEVAMMNHLQDLLQELDMEDGMDGLMIIKEHQESQEKTHFKITVQFNHNCEAEYNEHRICYPTVAACSNTIMLPVKHMLNYEDFKTVLMEGFFLGQEFLKV